MPTNTPSRLPWLRTPSWLAEIENQDIFPLRLLLKDSLYYPASACDGDPVRLLGGFIHSFVYVEYVMNKTEVMADMQGERHGFRGYRLSMSREVEQSELTPHGWQATPLRPDDGNPIAFQSLMPSPFAIWAIFDRLPDFDDTHGPARFSLLHICGDGAATFEALYNTQQIQPDVLAIIRPGTGYGVNWTDFRDAQKVLGRLAFNNRGGKPRYLLQEFDVERGGYWPGYERCMEEWPSCKGRMAVYECSNPDPEEYGVAGGAANGDYVGFAGIRRRLYETFKRNRDEA